MAAVDQAESVEFTDLKRRFNEFLDQDEDQGGYKHKVREMLEERGKSSYRLIVNLDDLRNWNDDLVRGILDKPEQSHVAFQSALAETAQGINPDLAKEAQTVEFYVGYEGSFGTNHVTPRGLTSNYICRLVCVEGIATKIGLVKPKIVRSVHYCPATQKSQSKEYRDETSLVGDATGSTYPTKDQEGNPLETEYGFSTYQNHQTLTIQEMPEHAPMGQIPCSTSVILDDDLADSCKPGDRVQIIGIYRGLPTSGKSTHGMFRTSILATNVRVLTKDVRDDSITDEDVDHIKEVAGRKDVYQLLSRSIAPSIFGHQFIKKALLLQMLGGVEKNINGTHLRGDINILMVGDPSTAKSQMLRYVLDLAPLAINTTGRGSSGVGLTAAVTSDQETGDRRLEAGAMVLADRGVVCIDEFDKMSEADRVAIHEVMEQQTVTIAKAGIHASLNARCSVVAAANPTYGQYDREKTPQQNVGLPDSLLSRFDLLFIVLDDLDDHHNAAVADHILRLHRYQAVGMEGRPAQVSRVRKSILGDNSNVDDGAGVKKTSKVFEKFNPMLHGGVVDEIRNQGRSDDSDSRRRKKRPEILSKEFLKKYIANAKRSCHPQLSSDAALCIQDAYCSLRQKQDARTLPVTARLLETLVRLSTAHARLRLSETVERSDCQEAVRLLMFALYHDTQQEGAEDQAMMRADDGNQYSDDRPDEGGSPASPTVGEKRRHSESPPAASEDGGQSKRAYTPQETQQEPAAQPQTPMDKLNAQLHILLRENEDEERVPVKDLQDRLPDFTHQQIDDLLAQLAEDGGVMVSDGFIFVF